MSKPKVKVDAAVKNMRGEVPWQEWEKLPEAEKYVKAMPWWKAIVASAIIVAIVGAVLRSVR